MIYLKNLKELEPHIPDLRVSGYFQSTEPKIFFRISANENRCPLLWRPTWSPCERFGANGGHYIQDKSIEKTS